MIIESRYGSRGNFKYVIKMPTITGSFTLLDVDCKEELSNFMI